MTLRVLLLPLGLSLLGWVSASWVEFWVFTPREPMQTRGAPNQKPKRKVKSSGCAAVKGCGVWHVGRQPPGSPVTHGRQQHQKRSNHVDPPGPASHSMILMPFFNNTYAGISRAHPSKPHGAASSPCCMWWWFHAKKEKAFQHHTWVYHYHPLPLCLLTGIIKSIILFFLQGSQCASGAIHRHWLFITLQLNIWKLWEGRILIIWNTAKNKIPGTLPSGLEQIRPHCIHDPWGGKIPGFELWVLRSRVPNPTDNPFSQLLNLNTDSHME